MKCFIAFDGNGNSGIQTKAKAIAWAADRMAKNTAVVTVHLAEVFEVVERNTPPVTVREFQPLPEEQATVAKAA